MSDIDKAIEVLKERIEAFKVASTVIRYDSAERAILGVRLEDLNYLLNKLVEIKKGENGISTKPLQ
jgi:hypothetical protein